MLEKKHLFHKFLKYIKENMLQNLTTYGFVFWPFFRAILKKYPVCILNLAFLVILANYFLLSLFKIIKLQLFVEANNSSSIYLSFSMTLTAFLSFSSYIALPSYAFRYHSLFLSLSYSLTLSLSLSHTHTHTQTHTNTLTLSLSLSCSF